MPSIVSPIELCTEVNVPHSCATSSLVGCTPDAVLWPLVLVVVVVVVALTDVAFPLVPPAPADPLDPCPASFETAPTHAAAPANNAAIIAVALVFMVISSMPSMSPSCGLSMIPSNDTFSYILITFRYRHDGRASPLANPFGVRYADSTR
jgi:hypothetical protein